MLAIPLLVASCQSWPKAPAISFSLVPVADAGGPESMETIRGSARSGNLQARVVLYSYSLGTWWVQPFASRPFTEVAKDFSWQNSIHLGQQYAALLVDAAYKPAAKLETLPARGNGVLSVTTAPGAELKPVTIHFSGYEWDVRQLSSNWGGKLNPYDPANAWVDPMGYLHLQIVRREDRWFCADIGLKESLGQGSYNFTVRDVANLDPAAVLRFHTWDHFKLFNGDLGVDVSRWGNANSRNSQFVVHPSYEPNNIHRFETPSGLATFSFRWRPGEAAFQAWRGGIAGNGHPIAGHTFSSGIPPPADEKIHISFYAYGDSPAPMREPAEVIVERFRYAP